MLKSKNYFKTVFRHIKNYRSNSIFIKNFKYTFIIFLIPMFFITFFVYSSSQNTIDAKIKDTTSSSLYQIRESTDTVLSSAKSIIIKTSLDTRSDSFFYSTVSSNISEKTVEDIKNLTNDYMNIFSYIDSIFLYSDLNKLIINHSGVISIDNYEDTTWLRDFYNHEGKGAVIYPRKYNNMYPYYITVMYPVLNSNNEKIGCGILNINIEELKSFITNDDNENYLFITDDKHHILYSNTEGFVSESATNLSFYDLTLKNDKYSGDCLYNNEASIITVAKSRSFPFKYTSITPKDSFHNNNLLFIFTTLGCIFISLIASIILTLIISFKTYEPLKIILSFIEKPEFYEEEADNEDEIHYIIKNMMNALQKNSEMETLLKKRLTMLKHAQVKTLQAQINPHFLYNTLENLNMLAIDLLGNKNKISDIVVSLSKLFRISANTKNYIVTLKDEIEYAKEYIKILKIRCGNKFEVVWDIPDYITDYLTVKLCLQPILENAVNHGIKFIDCTKKIHISAKADSDTLNITITDNGKGITVEERNRLNRAFQQQYTDEIDHIGLKNTNQRIKFIFGEQYGISIDEKIEKGTKINISLPKIDTLIE